MSAAKDPDPSTNGGWQHRLMMWDWNKHVAFGFPHWELEEETKAPSFVQLHHVRAGDDSDIESHALAREWDNVAEMDFYQRDFTDDGIPFVRAGGSYRSGWWFETFSERDRFLEWYRKR